jgi:hypothetical protein
MKELVRAPGHLGLFWSQILRPGEGLEQLQPERTPLGQALARVALPFETHDYTAAERQTWGRAVEILQRLKPAFEAEGSMRLYEDIVMETQGMVQVIDSGRISRFLYHVRL